MRPIGRIAPSHVTVAAHEPALLLLGHLPPPGLGKLGLLRPLCQLHLDVLEPPVDLGRGRPVQDEVLHDLHVVALRVRHLGPVAPVFGGEPPAPLVERQRLAEELGGLRGGREGEAQRVGWGQLERKCASARVREYASTRWDLG